MKLYKFFLLATVILITAFFSAPCSSAQSRSAQEGGEGSAEFISGGHRGKITALVRDEAGNILSAGEDGFIVYWGIVRAESAAGSLALDRFQISGGPISMLALRPGKTQIAAVASDEYGANSIAVWDYERKTLLFSKNTTNSVLFCAYSATGSALIVSTAGRLEFWEPEKGRNLSFNLSLEDYVTFAATGRSENTVLTYSPLGVLSYWDQKTQKELQRFTVPKNLEALILFGNNRFLAGINDDGFLVLDAVTGNILSKEAAAPNDKLFFVSPEGADFGVLSENDSGNTIVSYFAIQNNGRMTKGAVREIYPPLNTSVVITTKETIAAGTEEGRLWTIDSYGIASESATGEQRRVLDAVVEDGTLFFIDEGGFYGRLTMPYSDLQDEYSIVMEEAGRFNRIDSGGNKNNETQTLFWYSGSNGGNRFSSASSLPLLKTEPADAAEASELFFDKLPLRFPFRRASLLSGKALFLDTAGNVTVLSCETGEVLFSYNAPAAQDAAFADENSIVIARSASQDASSFLYINIETGETVPLDYPAVAAVLVTNAPSGAVYGAVVHESAQGAKTQILRLNIANPAASRVLDEYQGEDSFFSITEYRGNLVSTLGGGAHIRRNGASVSLERSPGFTRALSGGNARDVFLAAVDEEGSVCWYDERGKLSALLRLYENKWELTSQGKTYRGEVERRKGG